MMFNEGYELRFHAYSNIDILQINIKSNVLEYFHKSIYCVKMYLFEFYLLKNLVCKQQRHIFAEDLHQMLFQLIPKGKHYRGIYENMNVMSYFGCVKSYGYILLIRTKGVTKQTTSLVNVINGHDNNSKYVENGV